VQEFVLGLGGEWALTRDNIRIGENNVFAPANLRAAADNPAYRQLVHGWMDARLTLRYSGGMVRLSAADFGPSPILLQFRRSPAGSCGML